MNVIEFSLNRMIICYYICTYLYIRRVPTIFQRLYKQKLRFIKCWETSYINKLLKLRLTEGFALSTKSLKFGPVV